MRTKKLAALFLAGMLAASFSPVSASAKETAELEDTLVIYSTHKEEMLEVLADAFTEKTGVEVEFINLKGELADRVRSEKDNPQADIMFGGDTSTYMNLQAEGCFQAVQPEWADELDAAYKDADGYWYGTYRTPVVMFYNTDLLTAEEAPQDWTDLADEKYADMIVTRDSLSSSMRSTIAALISYISANDSEEAAWDFIAGLSSNTKNYYNSGSMMYQAIGKGEAAISLAVVNDVLDNRDENGMPFEMIEAKSGAITITDCIAAISNCPHPNAAAAFVEFAGGVEGEELAANEFNRLPALDSALENVPEWMKESYPPMELNWTVISENQADWLEKWETDYVDAEKTVASE